MESDIGVLEVLDQPNDWEIVCFLGPDRTTCEIGGSDLVGVDAVRVRLFEKKIKEEIIKKYNALLFPIICKSMNEEEGHMEADNIMEDLLEELGYEKIAEEYKKVKKWYS